MTELNFCRMFAEITLVGINQTPRNSFEITMFVVGNEQTTEFQVHRKQ